MNVRIAMTFFEGNAISLLRKGQYEIVFIEKDDEPDRCQVFCKNEAVVKSLQICFKKARRQKSRYSGIPEFIVDCPTDKVIEKLGIQIEDLRYGVEAI